MARSFFAILASLAFAGSVSSAHADSIATAPGNGMVRAQVETQGRAFEAYLGRSERPIADCASDCEFWAWPGKYRVRVFQGQGPRNDERLALTITSAGRYRFVPANGGAQNTGLFLGITGPVIGVAGLVLTSAALLSGCDEPCQRPATLYVGLGGVALGAGMSGVGWWLYAQNRARFELLPMPRGGLGLGTTVRF